MVQPPSAQGPLKCRANELKRSVDTADNRGFDDAIAVDLSDEQTDDDVIVLFPRSRGHDNRRLGLTHNDILAIDSCVDVTIASRPPESPSASGTAALRTCQIKLLGRFGLFCDDREVRLPPQARRVVAFLALNRHQATRRTVADRLWPLRPMERAQGALRSALWHIERQAPTVILAGRGALALAPFVRTDVDSLISAPREIEDRAWIADWRSDLLPDMDEEWLTFERELLRQRRIHALERWSALQRIAGRFDEAIEAAMAAVEADPLRESARAALIDAHLSEGNVSEAHRQLSSYERVLREELNCDVSPALRKRFTETHPRVGMVPLR